MRNEKIYFSIPKAPVRIYRSTRGAPAGPVCGVHYHSEIEMLYVTDGGMAAYADGGEYIASKGSVFFVNSRVPHSTVALENGTQNILLQFRIPSNPAGESAVRYLKRFMSTNEIAAYVFKPGSPEANELISYILNMYKEYTDKGNAYEYYMMSYLQSIIARLHRSNILMDANTVFDNKSIEKIYPALEYIDKNYNENVSLDELSALLNLNQYYFCRLFKKATNTTFVEYLNFVRVCKAEKLILKSDKSISEISYEVGFASLSYFNRTFKKYKSCSPTEYKKIGLAEDTLMGVVE